MGGAALPEAPLADAVFVAVDLVDAALAGAASTGATTTGAAADDRSSDDAAARGRGPATDARSAPQAGQDSRPYGTASPHSTQSMVFVVIAYLAVGTGPEVGRPTALQTMDRGASHPVGGPGIPRTSPPAPPRRPSRRPLARRRPRWPGAARRSTGSPAGRLPRGSIAGPPGLRRTASAVCHAAADASADGTRMTTSTIVGSQNRRGRRAGDGPTPRARRAARRGCRPRPARSAGRPRRPRSRPTIQTTTMAATTSGDARRTRTMIGVETSRGLVSSAYVATTSRIEPHDRTRPSGT